MLRALPVLPTPPHRARSPSWHQRFRAGSKLEPPSEAAGVRQQLPSSCRGQRRGRGRSRRPTRGSAGFGGGCGGTSLGDTLGAPRLPLPGFVLGAARPRALPRLHPRSPPGTLLPLPVHKLRTWCAELVGRSRAQQSASAARGIIGGTRGHSQKGLGAPAGAAQGRCLALPRGEAGWLQHRSSALALLQGWAPRG